MAQTAADICNLALSRVGQTAFIDSLTHASEAGRLCALHYPLARDAVLASFPWRFATRQADLAQLSGVTRNGWGYVYALPSDFVEPNDIWNGFEPQLLSMGMTPDDWAYFNQSFVFGRRVAYDVEDDATYGRILLAQQETASLSYVSNAVNVSRYPPLFVQALGFHLAAELALGFAKKPAVALALQQSYQVAFSKAAAAELRRAREPAEARPSSVSARD